MNTEQDADTAASNRKARKMLATYLGILLWELGFVMGALIGINLVLHHWLGF